MKYKYLSIVAFIFYSLAIIYFSHQSSPPKIIDDFNYQDKVLHLIAFFIYGCLTWFMLFKLGLKKKKVIFFTIIWGFIFGASDEIHQYFVPGRYSEFADWVADSLGILLSLLLLKLVNFADE